jgi:hypothetical protein
LSSAAAATDLARPALAALDRSGKILVQFGTIAPLALLLLGLIAGDVFSIF